MGRGAWQAIVHGVAESDMTEQLKTYIATYSQNNIKTDKVNSVLVLHRNGFAGHEQTWFQEDESPGEVSKAHYHFQTYNSGNWVHLSKIWMNKVSE